MPRFAILIAAALVAAAPLAADFVPLSNPDAAYIGSTLLFTYPSPDFTTVSSLTSGPETLTYSSPLTVLTVPVNWGTWNTPPAVESATPVVGDTAGSTLTISLSLPANTFGLELEPDNLTSPEEVTAQFFSGGSAVGTIDFSLSGDGGASLFAATTGTSKFDRIVFTNLGTDDFAVAQQRVGFTEVTPEPSLALMLASGLLLVGGAKWIAPRFLRR